MSNSFLIAAGPAIALLLVVGLTVVGAVRRERRGPEGFVVTMATSRPGWTFLLAATSVVAMSLVLIRLGVMS